MEWVDSTTLPYPSNRDTDDSQRNDTRNEFRILLSDLMSNSSVHGLPNIHRAESLSKRVFWTLSFLAAVGLFVGFSSDLITKYYARGVDVDIEVDFERDLTFPAVTICNMNPLRKSLLDENQTERLLSMIRRPPMTDEGVASNLTNATPVNNTRTNLRNQTRSSSDFNHWDNIDGDFYTSPTLSWVMQKQVEEYLADLTPANRQRIGHQLEDLLVSCQWNDVECSPRNFTHFLNTIYSNCYTFNGQPHEGEYLSTNYPGFFYGLTLELFIEQDEYLQGLIEFAGVRVTIHPQDNVPFPEDDGFNVEPGKLTSIGIIMGKVVRLPDPYTDCIEDESDRMTVFAGGYSVEACMKSCLLTYIASVCNCTDGRYPKPKGYDDVGHCLYENIDDHTCKAMADRLYQNNGLQCDCPPKCVSVTYSKEISSGFWPSLNSRELVVDTLKSRSSKIQLLLEEDEGTEEDLLGQNLLKLQIYFQDLNHQFVTQSEAYSSTDLLSDIGGNLGLWIGLSVLTVMEFLEFIFDMFAMLKSHCSRQRRPKTDVEQRATSERRSYSNNGGQILTSVEGDVYYVQRRTDARADVFSSQNNFRSYWT